jgi:hypothetical protein
VVFRSLKFSGFNMMSIGFPIIYRYEFLRFSKITPYVEVGISNVWNVNVTPEGLYFDYDALDVYEVTVDYLTNL